jgi:hypothetical protein
MNTFLLGAVAAMSLVASLFFLKFWRQTHDRFFLLFSLAFLGDAVDRCLLALLADLSREQEPFYYLVRLFTFGLIIVAVVDKNLRASRQ